MDIGRIIDVRQVVLQEPRIASKMAEVLVTPELQQLVLREEIKKHEDRNRTRLEKADKHENSANTIKNDGYGKKRQLRLRKTNKKKQKKNKIGTCRLREQIIDTFA